MQTGVGGSDIVIEMTHPRLTAFPESLPQKFRQASILWGPRVARTNFALAQKHKSSVTSRQLLAFCKGLTKLQSNSAQSPRQNAAPLRAQKKYASQFAFDKKRAMADKMLMTRYFCAWICALCALLFYQRLSEQNNVTHCPSVLIHGRTHCPSVPRRLYVRLQVVKIGDGAKS